jgi:tripeptide aminopeptidase
MPTLDNVADLFLHLVSFDTQSAYNAADYPSTPSQLAFGKMLAELCRQIGLSDVAQTQHGCVMATLPANTQADTPVIGFLAHMDTSPDAPGGPVRPRVVRAYDGQDIALNPTVTLSPRQFPHLLDYVGQDIIVTDGHTLLGADNKAGIAEILTAMRYLITHPEVKHGDIRIAFTPDEEVGRGADYFDVARFGAEYAYTVDGGPIGELEYENFNAARAVFAIKGRSVHPGTAYKTMLNAALVAADIINAMPPFETPAETQGRQGFYHLNEINAQVSEATLSYILRDFDADGLNKRKTFAQGIADRLNDWYGPGTVTLTLKDEYQNMHEVLKNQPHILQRARQALQNEGITPVEKPIRGGTDGARLSFMGLPCPNLFAGGLNAHGPYEYIPIPSMEAAVRVIVGICIHMVK